MMKMSCEGTGTVLGTYSGRSEMESTYQREGKDMVGFAALNPHYQACD